MYRRYNNRTSKVALAGGVTAAAALASGSTRMHTPTVSHNHPTNNNGISNNNGNNKNLYSMNNNNVHNVLAQKRAANFVNQQCIIQGVPGCTVAVIKNSKLIWTYCYGYSDIANNLPMTPYSIMRIASITKPLTATGIAVLLQNNQLSLDESVYDLFEKLDNPRANKIKTALKKKYPEFYEECKRFTVLQLCNHTSGLRHYKNNQEYLSTDHYKSLIGVLRNFANEPLTDKPGTKYRYSSWGYIMLGLIIEAVSDRKYNDFMMEKIIKPLQMNHTFLEMHQHTIIPNQTKQYIRKVVESERTFEDYGEDGIKYEVAMGGEKRPKYKDTKIRKLLNAPYSDSTIKLSSGAFLSCCIDVARFGHEVVLGNFLANRIKKMVFETNLIIRRKEDIMSDFDSDNEIDNDDIEDFGYKDIEYGLGWHVYRKTIDPLIYSVEEICHGGGANGGCAHLSVLPQQGLVVAVIMNLQQAKPTISRDIAKFFYDYNVD